VRSGGLPTRTRPVRPRAILNAVERLIGSAAPERDKVSRDLAIAQGQLRDYEARLGAGFAHAAYLAELTDCAISWRPRCPTPRRKGRGVAAFPWEHSSRA